MIVRIWHAWTTKQHADAYQRLLDAAIVQGILERGISGLTQPHGCQPAAADGRQESLPMIARIWRGGVRRQDGDAYASYMQTTGIAGYANTPGNRAAVMLRRDVGDRCEFPMFTLWDSTAAVTAFAGPEPEKAVFYPEDDRFLIERDLMVQHYEVDTAVIDPAIHAATPRGGPVGTPKRPGSRPRDGRSA